MVAWGAIDSIGSSLIYGLLSGASGAANAFMSYEHNRKLQQQQFENQKALNQQGYDLTQQGYREQYSNMRQGLENAGFNPILSYSNAGNASFSGGSASGASSNVNIPDLGESAVNAYQVLKLAKEKQKAEIQEIEARTKNINEDTKLKKYDKPLKFVGDLAEKNVYGEVVKPVVNNARSAFRNYSWSIYDTASDFYSYLSDKFQGGNIPYKYYKGVSKYRRIKQGKYKLKDLKYNY